MSSIASQLVRFEQGKNHFEILTHPGSAAKFREAAERDKDSANSLRVDNIVVTDSVFRNASKFEKASASQLKQAFGTADFEHCVRMILLRGQLQVSAAEKREELDRKKREVVAYINRNYSDQHGLPHPISRIEAVLVESKMRIDQFEHVRLQAAKLAKLAEGKLVFKKEMQHATVSVDRQYKAACLSVIAQFGSASKETSTGSGSRARVSWTVSFGSGDTDDFLAELNRASSGSYEFGLDAPASGAASSAAAAPGPSSNAGAGSKKQPDVSKRAQVKANQRAAKREREAHQRALNNNSRDSTETSSNSDDD